MYLRGHCKILINLLHFISFLENYDISERKGFKYLKMLNENI